MVCFKGTLTWDFFVMFFCTDQTNTYRPNNEWFQFCSVNLPTYSNFLTFGVDSVDEESHSPSIESTPSETSCWLSQCGVRLAVNWVNTEWWNLCKCWCLLRRLRWHVVSLRIHSLCERWIKPKQAHITSSGAFKGIGFWEINRGTFKYQAENAKSFYGAWSKKLTLH